MEGMKQICWIGLVLAAVIVGSYRASALSEELPRPKIFFPKGYDTNRAEAIHSVLKSDCFKYLDGMTSYWPPAWATTLVYEGDADSLSGFIAALNRIKDITVQLTFASDLSKETGSALRAGSWWVKYSHTNPDVITVRVNLAAETLGREKFELKLEK
jgi:hypothetical protein